MATPICASVARVDASNKPRADSISDHAEATRTIRLASGGRFSTASRLNWISGSHFLSGCGMTEPPGDQFKEVVKRLLSMPHKAHSDSKVGKAKPGGGHEASHNGRKAAGAGKDRPGSKTASRGRKKR